VRRVVGRPLGKVPKGSYFHETAGIWGREGGSSHLMGHAFMRKIPGIKRIQEMYLSVYKISLSQKHDLSWIPSILREKNDFL
jgi:hypothetical protein